MRSSSGLGNYFNDSDTASIGGRRPGLDPGPARRNSGQGTRWNQAARVGPERQPHRAPQRRAHARPLRVGGVRRVLNRSHLVSAVSTSPALKAPDTAPHRTARRLRQLDGRPAERLVVGLAGGTVMPDGCGYRRQALRDVGGDSLMLPRMLPRRATPGQGCCLAGAVGVAGAVLVMPQIVVAVRWLVRPVRDR
jgi:hypothetical protein